MYDTLKQEVIGNYIIPEQGLPFKAQYYGADVRKRYFNQDKQSFQRFGYLPKLNLHEVKSKYNNQWHVKRFSWEGSCPKMVHDTSYYMVFEDDKQAIINAVIAKLGILGLEVKPTDIEQGMTQIIAYCYNFYLPDGYARPTEFIQPLAQLDVGKRNGNAVGNEWKQATSGLGVKFWNSRRGISFYDRVAEIENNRFQSQADLEVLEAVKDGRLPHCFKIENTLQNRTAVKQALSVIQGDKDAKKERLFGDVLQDSIGLRFVKDVFGRLSDGRNVKALEQPIYPLEQYFERQLSDGLNFSDAQLLLAHAVGVQQLGSLRLKQIADNFPKYGRQYRYRYYEQLERVNAKVKGYRLSEFFDLCRQQLDNPIIRKPDMQT